jgi:hypothetical protein
VSEITGDFGSRVRDVAFAVYARSLVINSCAINPQAGAAALRSSESKGLDKR